MNKKWRWCWLSGLPCRAVECLRQQRLPRGVPAVQRLRRQPDGPQPEARPTFQEPDLLRPALCRRGPDGEFGFYAAVAQLQAAVSGLRRRPTQEQHDAHLPAASAGLFRFISYFLLPTSYFLLLHFLFFISNWLIVVFKPIKISFKEVQSVKNRLF